MAKSAGSTISKRLCLFASVTTLLAMFAAPAIAAEAMHQPGRRIVTMVPAAVAVRGELPPAPDGTTDLKFREFFKLPIGAHGLEPTDKLLSLDGAHVRVVGYMVQESSPTPGLFILSPLPVTIGDEDEALSDDLPPSSLFVHIESAQPAAVPYMAGLIGLSGTLTLGAHDEPGGRVSTVRLILDSELADAISAIPASL